jgi:hypothetical protein
VAAVERLDFTLRSRNNVSCLRRNRFSATMAAWEERNNRIKVNNSTFCRSLQVLPINQTGRGNDQPLGYAVFLRSSVPDRYQKMEQHRNV